MGSSKKKQTQTYTPPSWIEGAAQDAVGIGQRVANQEYTPYTDNRIAALSDNEQQGVRMASDTAGAAQPFYQKSAAFAERGAQQFENADMQQYMNPFIKGALDPVAREIRQTGARRENEIDARYSSMSAFGGSRAALMRSENTEKTIQGISDVYGKGYAMAYESAVNIWGSERARDMQASGRFQSIGAAVSSANSTDISTLMATGATDRGVQQSMMDFDYKQFIEDRDWDLRGLGALIGALQGTKGSYSTTTTTETTQQGGEMAQLVGLAATLIGAFYGGPAGASAGKGISDWAIQATDAGVS